MSITPELRAYARSTYRSLLRAAATTFGGDDTVLQAFRAKVRTETLHGRTQTDPALYEANVKHGQEVAAVLRQNIVQAARVQPAEDVSAGDAVWRLRLTQHTELGSNETIKQASEAFAAARTPCADPLNRRRARKQELKLEKEGGAATPATKSSSPHTISSSSRPAPRNYSALKRAHLDRKLPELREEDLEESFVRGSGPGGQSINKTNNNVQLVHKPTGIRVVCQETRSLSLNRMFARRILLGKLDQLENPGLSKTDLARAKQNERDRRRRKKAKKKAEAKPELQTKGEENGGL